MTQEALKLALEALLHVYHEDEAHLKTLQAITAIKEALVQSEEHNFCPRCGKRNKDIHTCTPPQD
jgi:NADH pyrophosphatase NudC (nudix superfamily)